MKYKLGDSVGEFRKPNDLDRDDIVICTSHFNPSSFKKKIEVYHRWFYHLGPLQKFVRTYELVFDNENQQIPGSRVVRGTREKNLMFQKEALINLCLKECESKIKYFVWMDHDSIIDNPDWLSSSICTINSGIKTVQPFSRLLSISKENTINNIVDCIDNGHKINCPGFVWVAERDFLDNIGGLIATNIIGGGDYFFMMAVNQSFKRGMELSSSGMSGYNKRYIDKIRKMDNLYSYLDIDGFHIYHGKYSYKQYETRIKVLQDNKYDPGKDVFINSDGILEFCSDKPLLRKGIKEYFDYRKEDE